jgi:hydroxymethylbilane synthase
MLRDEADFAVHSLKDVPMQLEGPFALGAVLERADPFDAFVSNAHASLSALPPGARVGTSSLRRQAQLRAARPDLQLLDLRGNVNTRLAKLDNGDYDAIILACAGLQRLGFDARIRVRLQAPEWLPAAAQGAIAIECREHDDSMLSLLRPLEHEPTRICVDTERAMNRHLHGSCQVPIAAYAIEREGELHLTGLVGDAATGHSVRASSQGARNHGETLGIRVAEQLLAQGAGALLEP